MQLVNDFTVPVAPDRAFAALLDVERVAPCMPGATLLEGDGTRYEGRLKLRIGPITAEYEGNVVIEQVDEASRTAQLGAQGSERRGQGSASARVAVAVAEEGEGARVEVRTDLEVQGRAAQFGRGVLGDVAQRVVDQFARNLEAELLTDESASRGAAEAPAAASSAEEEGRPRLSVVSPGGADTRSPAPDLDVLGAMALPLLRRAAPVVVAFVLGLLLGRSLGRRAAVPPPWAAALWEAPRSPRGVRGR